MIVYDYVNNAFSIHTGIEASFMNTISKSSVFKLYTGDYSGYVLEQDSGNTDALDGTTGQTINSTIQTAWFPLGNPAMFKSLQHLFIYHSLAGDFNMSAAYSFDFEDSDRFIETFNMGVGGALWDSVKWDQFQWSSSGGGNVTRIDTTGGGAFVRFHFAHNANNAAFEIYGITPVYRYEKIHRPITLNP